ncbi:bile acid:sodium symporter family protein [Phaeobacter sp. QD34_3]|uniref:bile acid:sodium symporter family protein n=1 Tax=unclassified Phaeobacter TaxID=2621772 RepID=UPI00237FD010|nr:MULTISPECIES: bile acid:sodium symporter family protein [unclassified Phaeobacter]MDE4135051.1 bile acid:sodium symporter family protein [Phaeobacter sp. QD34_3]MDE4138681.1 bile acid:sodium symporter family protein [Phaeobacter sp. QD34_24]
MPPSRGEQGGRPMLIDVGLPLSLAFIMFSLGFGLTFADFARVLAMPKAVLTGVVMQVGAVPLVAYLLLMVFDLPPAMAFGVMILSFCPGGVTSNILTKLAGGTVALSITLTAVVSLLSVVTVPILVAWAGSVFLGAAAPEVDVLAIGLSMFAITAVPVIIGLLTRWMAPGVADRFEKGVSALSLLLFIVIVMAALATNWDLMTANMWTLGPVLMLLNAVLLVAGIGVARLIGLSGPDGLCISVEMGVQNATLGIAVAGMVAQASGIPEYAVPTALYGITTYVVTIPGMFILKRVFTW